MTYNSIRFNTQKSEIRNQKSEKALFLSLFLILSPHYLPAISWHWVFKYTGFIFSQGVSLVTLVSLQKGHPQVHNQLPAFQEFIISETEKRQRLCCSQQELTSQNEQRGNK